MCHGDAPCIVQISLTGRVEYLADDGAADSYSDSMTALSAYLDHCRQQGLTPDRKIVGDLA